MIVFLVIFLRIIGWVGLYKIYTYRMKFGLAVLLLLAVSAVALERLNVEQLEEGLHSNRQIWLVYRSRTYSMI